MQQLSAHTAFAATAVTTVAARAAPITTLCTQYFKTQYEPVTQLIKQRGRVKTRCTRYEIVQESIATFIVGSTRRRHALVELHQCLCHWCLWHLHTITTKNTLGLSIMSFCIDHESVIYKLNWTDIYRYSQVKRVKCFEGTNEHVPTRNNLNIPGYHYFHTQNTLCLRKKRHPFYFCDNLVRCHSIWPILGRNIPQGIWNKTRIYSPSHLVVYVCAIPCKN